MLKYYVLSSCNLWDLVLTCSFLRCCPKTHPCLNTRSPLKWRWLLSLSLYNSIKSETATFQRYCPFFLQANTRWDSLVHTVTQAFRHSLDHTHTISVTFHYMVLGWISGLEIYQISTQGAPPPHPWYCLSTTMLNCFLFSLFVSKLSINFSMWIDVQAVRSRWREVNLMAFTPARWKKSDTHSFMVWIFMLTLGFVSEAAAV